LYCFPFQFLNNIVASKNTIAAIITIIITITTIIIIIIIIITIIMGQCMVQTNYYYK